MLSWSAGAGARGSETWASRTGMRWYRHRAPCTRVSVKQRIFSMLEKTLLISHDKEAGTVRDAPYERGAGKWRGSCDNARFATAREGLCWLLHWLTQQLPVDTRLIHQPRHRIGVECNASASFENA
jgi:hypothetical protein